MENKDKKIEMNREIKFRVWDISLKQYGFYTLDEMVDNRKCKNPVVYQFNNSFLSAQTYDIIMKCPNLKDLVILIS